MFTKNLKLAWLCLLLLPSTLQANNLEYWSQQDYLALFPEQKPLVQRFASKVRNPAVPLQQPLANTVRIVMLTPDQQVSDYWSRNQTSLGKRLVELGVPFSLQNYPSLPSTTDREQEQQLADALLSDPDYLVLTLNSPRHTVLLNKLMTRDRPKIILMNITTPLKDLKNRQPFLYVGFDHQAGTRLLNEKIKKITNSQANYLMLYGTRGYISTARGDEFIQLNINEPDMNLGQAFYTDVNPEKAKQAVLQTLQEKPNINLIYACTTDIALGAAQALKILNKEDKIILNGWGGGSAELDAIATGALDLTVMRMNDDNGVAIAEAIRLDQVGKTHLIPQIYSGDFVVIDKYTSKAELERLKDVAFRYSK
ncbi:substrate-binding domain-containing protein [Oceanisphaera sp. W20_SRM_FM3]|uniref:substrate-binding domain-containing protein n=1 Tax=Oceanisphaera sp. W20_SRM_FM3 TaxID=3240267 RepID=UPI003F98DBE6